MASGQGRVENVRAAEDAVRKVQRLKRDLARCRGMLQDEKPGTRPFAARAPELASELGDWEEQLESIRCDLADLMAERDRWRIAHDKLRERLERHTLEPRSEERLIHYGQIQTSPMPPRARASGESQDFTAIDQELERLNAAMLRAFSSE